MIGTEIGPYAVRSKLGEGGMGTVYLAHDTKLNRDVALKVLSHAVAGDPDRLARFRREAQLLAALNHPNIGQIFGIEDSGPSPVLVLELVEGPTLGDMLSAPLPVPEAVAIARQIADALEFAHERGIIHRDLKPANIKVRSDGTVKVLDFGLAKALDPSSTSAAPGSASANPALLSQSPTMTSPAMTAMGFIIGTAAYMSPEQAKGRPVDRRADIWAFGAVLYEMLTGRRAYHGEDVADSLAAVLTRELDWTSLPAAVPLRLRALLADCLVRDPKNRLRDIGDARRVLDQIATGVPEPVASGATSASAPLAPRWTRWLPWAVATIALVAAGMFAWRGSRAAAPTMPAPVIRAQTVVNTFAGFVTLSADGTKLIYTVNDVGGTALAARSMDQLDGRVVPGSTGGVFAVFSPDGRSIAYSGGNNKIRKLPIEGGTSVAVADGLFTWGADWGDDGTIVFSSEKGLMRVAATGGTAEPLTTVNREQHEAAHRKPQFLPGGKRILFTIVPNDGSAQQFAVVDTSSATPTVRKIAPGGDNGRYVPSGHLTYVRDTTLFAVPFDIDTLTVTGPETAIVESVSTFGPDGTGDYTFSKNGVLIYVQGTGLRGSTLAWADAKGNVSAAPGQVTQQWGTGSLSPDGHRVANAIYDGSEHDIWIVDLVRGVSIRVTTHGVGDFPIWTPDGRRVIYSDSVNGQYGLSSVDVDGSAAPKRVLKTPKEPRPSSISTDGRTLLYRMADDAGVIRSFVVALNDDGTAGTPHLLRSGAAADSYARLSPDGKWVAFQSNQSGDQAVYLMPFPGPGGVTRVSTGRSVEPRWSRDGRQLFFWESGGRSALWSVTVSTTPSLSIGTPTKVFDLPGGSGTTWDVAPDGRVLVERPPGGTTPSTTLVTVTNWFDELRRRVPPGKK